MIRSPLRRHLLAIAILLITSSLWAYKSPTLGTQNDEGVHVTAATLIADGKHVYRDFYENRTPGVEWLLGAFFSFTKPDVRLARILTSQVSLLTLASLIGIARLLNRELRENRLLPRRGPWASPYVTCALFGLTPLVIFWSRFTMLEHWQSAIGTLAVMSACLGASTDRFKFWFASGTLTTLALVFKQSALTIVATMGIFFFLRAIMLTRARVIREAWYWFLGLTLPLILFLTILALRGSLTNFLLFVSGFERLAPYADLGSKIGAWTIWAARQPIVPLAVAGLFMIGLQQAGINTLIVIWVAIEQLALFAAPELDLGWEGFSHYIIPSTAALALLGGAGYLWVQTRIEKRHQLLLASPIVLLFVFTIQGWLPDFRYAVQDTTYPMGDFQSEKEIGQAMSAITPESESVLVLANSVFYHHAGRYPGNLFFHYPEYLPTSSLNELAADDIQGVLKEGKIGTLAVSRMQLDTRLPSEIKSAMWENWTPIARFPYSYQGDVFLFLQKMAPTGSGSGLAKFEGEIVLLEARTQYYGQYALLVRLYWQANQTLSEELSVFTHLVDANGEIAAQNDGIPVVGFRPSTSWGLGETIEDTHWIKYDRSLVTQEAKVHIGLYNADTATRMRLLPDTDRQSYYVLELELE